MTEKVKHLLKAAGAEQVAEWDRYFGMGMSGALLSIAAGILILVFPSLIAYIAGVYLLFRGIFEAFRYTRQKSLRH